MKTTILFVGGEHDGNYFRINCDEDFKPNQFSNLVNQKQKPEDRLSFTTYRRIEQQHKNGTRFWIMCTEEIAKKFESGELKWHTYGDKANIPKCYLCGKGMLPHENCGGDCSECVRKMEEDLLQK